MTKKSHGVMPWFQFIFTNYNFKEDFMPEDKTDWKALHRFAQMRGFGLMGLMSVDILKKFGKDGERSLRDFFIKVGQMSATAFLKETGQETKRIRSDFENYCAWQDWFMASQRADNSGSQVKPVTILEQKDGKPTHVRAERIGCMINNAWDALNIKDIATRKKLCNIFTEIDYGVRDIIGKDCIEFVRFDCQSEREHGDPGLPQGKPFCVFEIKIKQ